MRQLFLHVTCHPFKNLEEMAAPLRSNVPTYACKFALSLGLTEMCSTPEPIHGP